MAEPSSEIIMGATARCRCNAHRYEDVPVLVNIERPARLVAESNLYSVDPISQFRAVILDSQITQSFSSLI